MKKTRIFAALLAALLLLCCTAIAEEGFPLTETPVTFKIMARTPSFYPNQDLGQVYNMQVYEEMTGVDIDWENVDPSVFANTLAASIAADDLPDIILKGYLTNDQLYSWGEDGILVDLAPYIEEYAPNFNALMEQYPDIRKSITAPDGGIYGLPQVVLAPQMRVPCKLFINTAALEKLGMEMPATLDDLYAYLVAFRDSDFNGNGIADEIPISSTAKNLYKYFYGCFGVRSRGAHHDVVDVDPATGELRIFAQSEDYRKFLEFLHKCYAEKLIYQEIFTDGEKNNGAFAAEDRLGAIVATTLYNIPTEKSDAWAGVKGQLDGETYGFVSEVRSNLHSTGNFAITDACENVELALRWVDYFYSEEGSLFYHAGVEGVNWEKKADGTLGYTEECAARRTGSMTQDAFIAEFAMWPGGRNPSVMLDNLWGGEYEAEPAATAMAMIEDDNDIVWPFFSWTADENEVIATTQTDILTFITNSTAQAVAGEVEITDEWWNAFVANIDSMGGQKLIDTYQSAVDRIYAGEAY